MPLPKFYEFCKPLLEIMKDGQPHTLKELRPYIIQHFNLTQQDLEQMLPSGRQSTFLNRLSWAKTYLLRAGLLDSPTRATIVITQNGLDVLQENPPFIDIRYLMRFEGFRQFKNEGERRDGENTSPPRMQDDNAIEATQDETPDVMFELSFRKINDSLAEELLSAVMKISPTAFEQMVIDLLSKMGYGAFENAGRTTAASGDEGIDGVIMEDKLGFSLIYIQAKKWERDKTVGRPELQAFVGAISGKGGKGLFVTTAKFSKQAEDYARLQHIILIDGDKLARLMIAHNFCVSVKKVFEIKAIDTDAFIDYED